MSVAAMRYLILGDIHSSWEALRGVLEHAEGRYETVLCTGDLVGYGADPNAVVDWVRKNVGLVVRGNHDRGCAGLEDPECFNPAGRAALVWTRLVLTAPNKEYLRRLPPGPLALDGIELVHGSPHNEDEYLLELRVPDVAPQLQIGVTFFGHTHLQGGFLARSGSLRRIGKQFESLDSRAVAIDPEWRYLINPGSVGQPRDRDARAAYALFDAERRVVSFHRVSYDVPRAQGKIRAAGLPESLSARLEMGR